MELVKAINTTSRALNLSVGVAQPGDIMDVPLPEVQVWCDFLAQLPAPEADVTKPGPVEKVK